MRPLRAAALTAALFVAAPGCAPSGHASDRGLAAQPAAILAIAGAANTGVSLAASGRHVVAVWAGSTQEQSNVYAAVSDDGAATFAAPVRVNDVEGDARISGDQAPRVAIGNEVVVVWESKLTGDSRIRLARSRDGGRTFQPAETAHAESLSGARGWASIALDPGGAIQLAWLDGRNAQHDMSATPPGHAGMHHAMEQDLFHLTLRPDGTRSETRIARDVCFCCKTSVASAPGGETYVAWRHVYPTNLRDIAVARSADGGRSWSAPVRVSEDHWQIDACPEDGPSLAVDASRLLRVAWPTMLSVGRKAIFYSDSIDGGRAFSPRIRLDSDDSSVRNAAHVQLAVDGDDVVAVWDEMTTSGHRLVVRTIERRAGGTEALAGVPTTIPVEGSAPSLPAIAVSDHALVVAWTTRDGTDSQIRVQRIDRAR